MKYSREYRDPKLVHSLADEIRRITTRPWTIMEVCGGQTHAIVRFGLDQLLPKEIELVHGPGCPVCVTDVSLVDQAIELAERDGVVLCTFGDMSRVPGSEKDLLSAKAAGGNVKTVYSPMDALQLANENPDLEVVFFAVGFETTAPTTALTVERARAAGIDNYSLLVAHVLVPPVMEALLESPGNRVQGFLAAGHVCTVTGYRIYEPVASSHGVPVVVTGFEPADILKGVLETVRLLEDGRAEVQNAYSRAVKRDGNPHAWSMVERVFEVCDRSWRGIGTFPGSGLKLRGEYAAYDAGQRFTFHEQHDLKPSECISGLILQGAKKPPECPLFGTVCTPESPLGATMVSSEGACAAYYLHRGVEGTQSVERS
ncbi:hydrogenase formation protein HypD [bacterium]|nr:hydrogenase formation protein HypD [bacterium]